MSDQPMPDPEGQATCNAEHGLWGVTCDRPAGHVEAGWLHHHGIVIEYRRKAVPVPLDPNASLVELVESPALQTDTAHRIDIEWIGPEGTWQHPAGTMLIERTPLA